MDYAFSRMRYFKKITIGILNPIVRLSIHFPILKIRYWLTGHMENLPLLSVYPHSCSFKEPRRIKNNIFDRVTVLYTRSKIYG